MTSALLFGWLQSLYPLWTAAIDEEAEYLAAWVGLAELALSGCTTSSDHHYLHPVGRATCSVRRSGPQSISACASTRPMRRCRWGKRRRTPTRRCRARRRRHPRRIPTGGGTPSRPQPRRDGPGCARPCSPFSVSEDLMIRSAELAERLDVRLHTHLAENSEDDEYAIATFGMRPVDYYEHCGWMSDRSWGAHVVMPNPDEVARLGAAGVGIAHCPSSNMILSSGIAPVVDLRHAGCHVGLGCDGSSSADSASLWQELACHAAGQAEERRRRNGCSNRPEISTCGAGCLGRIGEIGELSVGAVGDIAVWKLSTARSSRACSTTSSRAGCEPAPTRPGTRSSPVVWSSSRACSSHRISTKSSQRTRLLVASNRPTESSGLPSASRRRRAARS